MNENQKKLKGRLLSLVILLLCVIMAVPASVFGADGEPEYTPDHNKGRQPNNDGTYKISLDVTGKAQTTSTTAKANVLIVYDTSGSMLSHLRDDTGSFGHTSEYTSSGWVQLYKRQGNSYTPITDEEEYNGTVYTRESYYGYTYYQEYDGLRYNKFTRAASAEKAVNRFVDGLLSYNTSSEPSNVQLSLVTFARNASTVRFNNQTWTTSDSIETWFNSDGISYRNNTYSGITNWEGALRQAITVLGSADNDPTYVVFITDGAPTANASGGTGEYNVSYYRDALDEALHIQQYDTNVHNYSNPDNSNTQLYAIYAFGNEADNLDDLVYYAQNGIERPASEGGVSPRTVETNHYYNASNSADLDKAIADIFAAIVDILGVTDVTVNDGTTSAVETTSGEVSYLLNVDETSYDYYMTFPMPLVTNEITRVDPVSGEEYKVKVTKNSDDTYKLTWKIGNTDYSVDNVNGKMNLNSFEYKWESANDFYNYNPPEANLENSTVKWDLSSVRTLLDDVKYTVTFDVYPSQETFDIIADIDNSADPEAAYAALDENIKQYLIRESNGSFTLETNTNASVSWKDTRYPDNPGPFSESFENPPRVSTAVSEMSISKLWENALDSRTASDAVTMDVLRTDKDGNTVTFENVTVGPNADPDKDWKDSVYIATGLMRTIKTDGQITGLQVLDPGYDYTLQEPDNVAYYWQLDIETVHPMLIDGTLTTLIEATGNDIPAAMKSDSNLVYCEANGHKFYRFNNSVYYAKSEGEQADLIATNNRKSNINLKKIVDGDAPEDSEFEFSLTVDDSSITTPTEDGQDIWFSVFEDTNDNGVLDTGERLIYNNELTTNATPEMRDGSHTGYYYFRDGGTVTVRLKDKWNLRVINLEEGSTYKYVEQKSLTGGEESNEFSISKVEAETTVTATLVLPVGATPIEGEQGKYQYGDVVYTEKTGTTAAGTEYTYYEYLYTPDISSDKKTVEGEVVQSNTEYSSTYTNVYELTNITVNKTWTKGGADSVTVHLYKDGTKVSGDAGTATLNADNNWTYNFKDLERLKTNGEPIVYTVKEDAIDGYAATYSGKVNYTVSLSDVPEGTGAVTVKLMNGDSQIQTAVANADNGWTATFNNVDYVNADGDPINYTAALAENNEDIALGTLTPSDRVVNIANSATVDKTATKVWNDSDYVGVSGYTRPASVVLQLKADNENVGEPVTVTGDLKDENDQYVYNWTHTFEDLPKFNSNGDEISYTVEETAIEGFTTTYSDDKLTVTNTPIKDENDVIDPVSMNILKKDANTGNVLPGATFIISKGGTEWQRKTTSDTGVASFTFTEAGTYTMTETAPDGYADSTATWTIVVSQSGVDKVEKKTTGNTTVWTWFYHLLFGDGTSEFTTETLDDGTVVNTLTVENTPETTEVSGTKVWSDNSDQDGVRPDSVTFQLYKTVNGTRSKVEGKTVTLSKPAGATSNSWTSTAITGLPAYEDGYEVTYSFVELKADGTTEVVDGGAYDANYTASYNGTTVTNTHTTETTSVKVTKVWDDNNDQDGKRPESVEVTLKAGDAIADVADAVVTLDEDNNWTYTWTGLDKKAAGTVIEYTVVETETAVITGQTAADAAGDGTYQWTVEEDAATGGIDTAYKVTNKHTPFKINISGTKSWPESAMEQATDEGELTRPDSVTILLKVGNEEVDRTTATKDGNWAWSFTDLDKYDDGEEIEYKVYEVAVDGFESEINDSNYSAVTVINTPIDEEEVLNPTDIVLKKTDSNTGNEITTQAVFELTKPDGTKATVNVTGHTTVRLDKDGEYTLKETSAPEGYSEENLPSYTITVTKDLVEVKLNAAKTIWQWIYNLIAGSDSADFTVVGGVNTLTVENTPETTNIPVTKTWVDANDQDGVRPGSVTFQLYKKVGDADPVPVNGKTIEVKGTRTNNSWTATFEDLPSYEDGKAVTYSVVETNAPTGYEASPTTPTGTTITNTHTPATTSFNVNKVWLDGSNVDGVRPGSVTFQLYKTVDGKRSKVDGQTITVSGTNETDTWSATFTGLPEKEDGKTITYSVEEVGSVAEYKEPVQTSDSTITNPHVLYDKTSAVVKGTKTLVGRNINAGEFTFKIELTKTPAGVNASRVTIPANASVKADGSFEFAPIEFKDAGEYEFRVTEVKGSLGGVTYDEHAENVKITVTEMTGDGGQPYLTSSVDYGKNEDGEAKNGVEFRNTYSAEGTFQPNGKKTLNGVVEPEEETTTQDDAVAPTAEPEEEPSTEPKTEPEAENASDEPKNEVSADAADDNKDADENGATGPDDETAPAEPAAATDEDPAAKAPAAEPTRDTSDDYQKPENAELVPVSVPAGKFTFEIRYLKNGEPYGDAIFTGSNSASGSDNIANVAFSSKTYKTEDLEALVEDGIAVKSVENGKTVYTVNYIVSEKDPKTSAIAKNPATYNITVKFTDDGAGTLTATVDNPTAMFSFENYYKTENAVTTLTGLKILQTVNGTRQLKANEFTFKIEGVNGAPMPAETQVKNDANGNVVFGPIKFTKKDLGNTDTKEFTYTISEIDKTDTTIDYSAITDQTVTVVVKETIGEDGKGTLTASIKGLTPGDPMYTFVNKYEPEEQPASITDNVEVSKVLEGAALKASQFEFTFAAADAATEQAITDQKVVMPATVKKANAADGSVKFDKVTYKKAGVYNFKITEVIPEDAVAKFTDADGNVSEVAYGAASPEQKAAGGFIKNDIKYDNKEYTVKVTVEDDNEGSLVVSHELVGSETAVFTNVKQHTDLIIKKNLADFVKQTDENGNVIPVTASFAFRITGKYPDGSTYSNVAGLDFTQDSPLDQEVVIRNVPTGLTDVTVTEIYSGNFSPEGNAAKPAVIQQEGDAQYLYKYLVEFKNTHIPNNDDFNHGVTNKYEKGESGYVHNGN